MKALLCAVALFAVVAALPATLSAQWPDHRDARAPRLPDGKVDMSAPAPRTADGKPDLSGVWRNAGGGGGRGAARELVSLDEKPLASFANIGAGFKGGLPLQPWAADLLKQRMAANSRDNPDVWCLPLGNIQFNVHSFPRKIIQNPGVILILYETHMGLRQIFTDGRPLPGNDPQPWFYGYSVGRWEGDTLVVETTGFKDGGWLASHTVEFKADGTKVTAADRAVHIYVVKRMQTFFPDIPIVGEEGTATKPSASLKKASRRSDSMASKSDLPVHSRPT